MEEEEEEKYSGVNDNTAENVPGEENTKENWKDVKKYRVDMQKLVQLMKVNGKLSVKKAQMGAPKVNKCDHVEWDALPWDGPEQTLDDLPIHPPVLDMWKALFSRNSKTPLQKLMITVNCGVSNKSSEAQMTKADLVDSLDNSIRQVDKTLAKLALLEDNCDELANDIRRTIRDRGIAIPEKIADTLDQMTKDTKSIEDDLSKNMTSLQDVRMAYAPPEVKAKSPVKAKKKATARKAAPKKRKRGT